jgi:2-haloalkanoic acid dehalogenase type II
MGPAEEHYMSIAKIVTFDCYGTLVQWREVLLQEIGDLLSSTGRDNLPEPLAVLATFSQHSRQLQAAKPHRLYKDVLRVGFRAALADHGLAPTDADIDRLASSITRMGPHPEVPGVLRRLRENAKLAIFTNSDDDLIVHNVEKLGVPIDYVITAEQAQAYKPSRDIFEYGYKTMGVSKDDTAHVAAGMFLDMKACHELGLRAIWINRYGDAGKPEWLPYEELPDLSGVPSLLLT